MTDDDRRLALAAFLRHARESLRPAEIGLPARRRPRTPGLRREDVAELADISVTYYSWLEQARPVKPSLRVLDRIADALSLQAGAREELFALARPDRSPARPNETLVRVAAFLPSFIRECPLLEPQAARRLALSGLHTEANVAFALAVGTEGIIVADAVGASEELLGTTIEIAPENHYYAALSSGHVIAESDVRACSASGFKEFLHHAGAISVLLAPIAPRGSLRGIIGYAEPTPRYHDGMEADLIRAVAATLAQRCERELADAC